MSFSTDEMKASYSKCGIQLNHIPNLGGHQIPGDSNGKMSFAKEVLNTVISRKRKLMSG